MVRKLLSNLMFKNLLRIVFSFFYDKKYLSGFYFDKKCMGWFWALRSLRGKIGGENRGVPWPVHPRTIVNGSDEIYFNPDDLHIFQVPGCYWQARDASIIIGRNCHVAPNVGIITTNHDIYDPSKHVQGENIEIADNCWIGMNSMILPGVKLGKHTIVAAGAVVTKSFVDGYCVIAGVPAKKIKEIDPSACEMSER